MLEKDESIEHIEEWSKKHEAEVKENDVSIGDLQNRIKKLKGEKEERKARED